MADRGFYMDGFERGSLAACNDSLSCVTSYIDSTNCNIAPVKFNWGESERVYGAQGTSTATYDLSSKFEELSAAVKRLSDALGIAGEATEKMNCKIGVLGRLRRRDLKTLKER